MKQSKINNALCAAIVLGEIDDVCKFTDMNEEDFESVFVNVLICLVYNKSNHVKRYLDKGKELFDDDKYFYKLFKIYSDQDCKMELKDSIIKFVDSINNETYERYMSDILINIVASDMFNKDNYINLLDVYSKYEGKFVSLTSHEEPKLVNNTMPLIIIQRMLELFPEMQDELSQKVINIYNKKESIDTLLANGSRGSILHSDDVRLLLKVKSFKMILNVLKTVLPRDATDELFEGMQKYIEECGLTWTLDLTTVGEDGHDGKDKTTLTGYDSDYDDLIDKVYPEQEQQEKEDKQMEKNIQNVLDEIKEIYTNLQ